MLRSFIVLSLLMTTANSEKKTIPVNEQKSISVTVSNRSVNRISVLGDRIQEIVLTREDIGVEKDDSWGHAYIRIPKESTDPFDLTVVTESGTIQDLHLKPKDQSPVSLVLTKEAGKSDEKSQVGLFKTDVSAIGTSSHPQATFHHQVMVMMKKLVQGEGTSEVDMPTRKSPAGVAMSCVRTLVQMDFQGFVLDVTNTGDDELTLTEKDFYELGDLALSLDKHSLNSGETTQLLVVRHAHDA